MFVTIAVDQMVIDHPGRLHESVDDRRPDELEAAALQLLGDARACVSAMADPRCV
jgi:hypothetical protein